MYISNQSNHPEVISKTISSMVNHRLSELSSSKEIFELNKKPYNNALTKVDTKHKKGTKKARNQVKKTEPEETSLIRHLTIQSKLNFVRSSRN